jgi:hypothetical protein
VVLPIESPKYDWDLAINWVVLHIDGVNTAKKISLKSEVDPEMATERAAVMLAGEKDTKLLQEAVDFVPRQSRGMESGDAGSDFMLPEESVAPGLVSGRETDREGESFPSSSFPQPGQGSLRSIAKIGSLAAAAQDVHTAALTKKENRRQKAILAELYASCRRNSTIGDILLETDSRTVMNGLDHRRFVTFGLVHGLIHRVHNYPLAQHKRDVSIETDDFFIRSTPTRSGKMFTEGEGISRSWSEGDHNGGNLASQIAAAMDGMACDDELACRFEMNIEELIEMVESGTSSTVVSLYSTGRQ